MNEGDPHATPQLAQPENQSGDEAQDQVSEIGATALTEVADNTTDPGDPGNPSPHREDDYDKAHDMAIAGYAERSQAAHNRAEALFYENETKLDPTHFNQLRAQDYKTESERRDRRAAALEHWAEILHDHPISQEYRDTHRDVDFEPSALVGLERVIEANEREVASYEKRIKELEENGYLGVTDERIPMYDPNYLYETGDEETIKKWEALQNNKDTTLGELGKFWADIVRRARVEPIVNQANLTRVLLDDVRSGRSSTPPPSEAAAA